MDESALLRSMVNGAAIVPVRYWPCVSESIRGKRCCPCPNNDDDGVAATPL